MKIGVVDYGMGNLTSVINALNFIGKESHLVIHPDQFMEFETFILPGVGAFGKAMSRLKSTGMDKAILDAANHGKKIVGICLGMQLLFTKSFEFGEHNGLGLIEGEVLSLRHKIDLRVPHMGWNEIVSNNEKFNQFNSDYYFVHSFYCQPIHNEHTLFETNYGLKFCSGVKKDNHIFGLQFHPEKSQKKGLELLSYILK